MNLYVWHSNVSLHISLCGNAFLHTNHIHTETGHPQHKQIQPWVQIVKKNGKLGESYIYILINIFVIKLSVILIK